MELRELNNKEEWEGFLKNCEEKTFLQSWNWGEFNEKMGDKIWRFGIFENKNLISTALAVKISAKRGNFLFIPHGPNLITGLSVKDKKEILWLILSRLNEIAKEEKISFIRISPLWERNENNQNIFSDLGFRPSPMHSSAYEATWKLDIYPSEQELLRNMRKTTRYLIKKTSEDKSISIEKSTDVRDIGIYLKLNKEVSKRQGFIPFSDEFIKNEFEIFSKDNEVLFLFGKYSSPANLGGQGRRSFYKDVDPKLVRDEGEFAAGALVIFWSGLGFYHQAASAKKFAKFSIPYLLQWEAIKEAKNRGCKMYDFWGFVDPDKFPKHPWAGPTLFKMGFGGYKKEYIKTQDYIVSNKYWINYMIERIRKLRRNL